MLRARDLKRHQKQGPGLWTLTFSLLILSIFIGPFIAPKAWATPQQVKVNVTHFPPFYVVKRGTAPTGLGIDLIKAMNQIQSKYRFETIETSPRRRHPMFEKGFYDVSLFDHLAWGWNKDKVEATSV